MIELTVFTKDGGPLTKRISLGADGKIVSDVSACAMSWGVVRRARIAGVEELAALIESLELNQAIGLGALRPELPNEVAIVTQAALNGGRAAVGAIARTRSNFTYHRGEPALVLFDYDTKGMPKDVAERIDTLGGFWPALASVIPALATVSHLIRSSTSAGLRRTDTGETFKGSSGRHGYVVVEDGGDAERFLATVHERRWLAGLGWMIVGTAGQMLERSIVDRMVSAPERLVFEGPPVVEPPLTQDAAGRRPLVVPGAKLDSRTACPPLTVLEKQTLDRLRAATSQRLAPEKNKARDAYIASEQQRLVERTGMTAAAAAAVIEKQTQGILLASIELPFDDPDLAGKTVGDVLDDPARFEGETLADPIEGVAYGRCKAKVMRGAGGAFINSFAHGHAIYQLRYDAEAVRQRIAASTGDLMETFVRLVLMAELDAIERHALIAEVARRTNNGVKPIKDVIKAAEHEQAKRQKEEARQRRRAERNDPRPELLRMADDSPLTEEMTRINSVISEAPLEQQIRRDLEGYAVRPRWKPVPNTHAFSSDDKEDGEAPEQWTIGKLDEYGLTEEIERLMNYIDEDGRSVAPPMRLVRAYTRRDDRVLYVLAAIATQPIVLADGKILGRDSKFEPERGIQFMVPERIAEMVPKPEDCTPEAVARAMQFLTDEWLVDVATDYTGKCVAVAAAMTIVERSLLPERPVFIFDAGKSSIGKTTTIKMIIMAVTGHQTAASAWSLDENERRKAITTYFLDGVPYILWDNISRGFQIACPHIERSCTAAFWSDRLLGANASVATAASTIHLFTGNNIGAKGDLAGRSLKIILVAHRHDPENRPFKHPDPVDWTLKKRDKILGALFTVLLGNPTLKKAHDAQMKTRFPTWWRLVGSAVEHAALQAVAAATAKAPKGRAAKALNGGLAKPVVINFANLFVKQRVDDEDDSSLGEVLGAILKKWPKGCESKDVSQAINHHNLAPADEVALAALLKGFLFDGPKDSEVSARSVGKRLAQHVDNVISWENRTLVLRAEPLPSGGGKGAKLWKVRELKDGEPLPEDESM